MDDDMSNNNFIQVSIGIEKLERALRNLINSVEDRLNQNVAIANKRGTEQPLIDSYVETTTITALDPLRAIQDSMRASFSYNLTKGYQMVCLPCLAEYSEVHTAKKFLLSMAVEDINLIQVENIVKHEPFENDYKTFLQFKVLC